MPQVDDITEKGLGHRESDCKGENCCWDIGRMWQGESAIIFDKLITGA